MITFLKNKKNILKEKGFTLLFAVLVSTLIISISATVISIALRQTIISGTSRESQFAFYATNTALECAFYWDVIGVEGAITGVVFPAPSETRINASESADITCSGGNIVTGDGFDAAYADKPWDTSTPNETTIFLEIKDVSGEFVSDGTSGTFLKSVCAQATVTKSESGGVITTTISAKGYNTCDLTSPRAVERGLIQSYQS